MDVKSIRGTHDILPGAVELWQQIESTARSLFALYGFAEIRTPILEETALFARSIGAETDIVQKEMYSFEDTGGKSVTLRPEGTAPVVRSYLEHHLDSRSEAVKVFYIGPMFRRERPQKGRYRQFHQIGAEVLGTDHAAVEAEVIDFLRRFLREMGLIDYQLLVNSVGCSECRPPYLRKLQSVLTSKRDSLCARCRQRADANPLRIFDCKVPSCQPAIETLPKMADHLCRKCTDHYVEFLDYLEVQDIPYQKNPRLVRGLDYYVRTTFEIVSDRLGATQNALLGGGRYDGLSEALGGGPTQGFGFALGLERFVLLLSEQERISSAYKAPRPDLFLAYLDEEAFRECLKLASQLREADVRVSLDFEGRSLKAQLRMAHRLHAAFSCTVGEDELRTGVFPVKRMSDGHQARLQREQIAAFVRSRQPIEKNADRTASHEAQ